MCLLLVFSTACVSVSSYVHTPFTPHDGVLFHMLHRDWLGRWGPVRSASDSCLLDAGRSWGIATPRLLGSHCSRIVPKHCLGWAPALFHLQLLASWGSFRFTMLTFRISYTTGSQFLDRHFRSFSYLSIFVFEEYALLASGGYPAAVLFSSLRSWCLSHWNSGQAWHWWHRPQSGPATRRGGLATQSLGNSHVNFVSFMCFSGKLLPSLQLLLTRGELRKST